LANFQVPGIDRAAHPFRCGSAALCLRAFAVLSSDFVACGDDFGLRWQSAAATPLFHQTQLCQSGAALRFPPQSKNFWLRFRRAVPKR